MVEYIIIGVILLAVYVIYVYNRLISQREAVRNDLKQIDIQLDRRYKVFESLISAVKKYMDYEKTVLKDVVSLRAQAQSAKASGDEANRIASENAISKIFSGIHAVMEGYPELKANQNVMQLQEEIVSTENKLSFAKQAYNDGTERFNALIMQFPVNMVVSLFGDQFQPFIYWQLSEGDSKKKDEYIARM